MHFISQSQLGRRLHVAIVLDELAVVARPGHCTDNLHVGRTERGMRIRSDQLSRELASEHLAPFWLVAGDEPLLAGEAADAIRARA